MKFSILGYKGFIGSNLLNFLEHQRISYEVVDPDDKNFFKKPLGHVIYSIGLTGDFRERPFDMVESHVCLLKKILEKCDFKSFLYLSSTRVYSNSNYTNEESDIITNPNKFDDIYNISKILGESICLSSSKQNIRIVRLSNVVGYKNNSSDLLSSIFHDMKTSKKIQINIKPESEKDYVYIDDVMKLLPKISLEGKEKIYNVASGNNITIKEITDEIQKITNVKINFSENAIEQSFKKINIDKIKVEFKFRPTKILDKLKEMIKSNK